MLAAIPAILNLLRVGQEVANKDAWRKRQVSGNQMAMLLGGLLNVASILGASVPAWLDVETVNALGFGVVGAGNIFMSVITSKDVGVLPAKNDAPTSTIG